MLNKALDFRFMLLEYYRELRISETDLVIILFIEHLQQKETGFVTPDLINLQSNIDIRTIDESMVKLVSKGFIEFTSKNGQSITSLNPLRKKLQELFTLSYEQKKDHDFEDIQESKTEIYTFIQKALGRSLSPIELETVNNWFRYGYSETLIKEAVEQSIKKRKLNIRAIDKILLQLATAVDYMTEGTSAQDNSYRKDITTALDEINKQINNDEN